MIRVLIAEHQLILLHGIERILNGTTDIRVAGHAAKWDEVIEKTIADQHVFDLVLIDTALPGGNWVENIRYLRSQNPSLPLLVLSDQSEGISGVRAIRAGARGYLSKGESCDILIEAIRRIVRGGKYIPAALAEKLVTEINLHDGRQPHEKLSEREAQVMRMIGTGASVREIAETFTISPKTVGSHRTRILRKIGVASNRELVRYMVEFQLFD